MFAGGVQHINQRTVGFLVALAVLVTPLLSAANGSVRAAPAYTEVGGPIISDTTWTLANSPYIVVANVEVWQGVTLTIQSGVVVKFSEDKLLQVDGTLIARGTAGSPITFTSNQASPAKGDWKNINGNSVTSGYGPYGGGIYASNSTVTGNTIVANRLSVPTGQGSGVYFSGGNDFSYNTIVGNIAVSPTAIIGGVAIDGTPQFYHNNLYGNSNSDVVVLSSGDISSTHNYWGSVATVDILAHVYDWYDDSTRGRLLYIPYSQDPDPNAPVPPPQNLRANFAGGSASLSWDAIPSTTTGYKVYYDTDASGPPYQGTGATQGNSPIDVGNATHFTLSGLSGGVHVAVTAYDTQGRESWYSLVFERRQQSEAGLPAGCAEVIVT